MVVFGPLIKSRSINHIRAIILIRPMITDTQQSWSRQVYLLQALHLSLRFVKVGILAIFNSISTKKCNPHPFVTFFLNTPKNRWSTCNRCTWRLQDCTDTQNCQPDTRHSTSARHWHSYFQVDIGHSRKIRVNTRHSDPHLWALLSFPYTQKKGCRNSYFGCYFVVHNLATLGVLF